MSSIFEFSISKLGYLVIFLKVCAKKILTRFLGHFWLIATKMNIKMKKYGKMSSIFEFSISKLSYMAVFMKLGEKRVFGIFTWYAFQSEFTLHSCLNIKELLSRNKRDIWKSSDCNGTRNHHHLACKRTLNHLANPAWVFVNVLSGCGFESRCSHLSLSFLQLDTVFDEEKTRSYY